MTRVSLCVLADDPPDGRRTSLRRAGVSAARKALTAMLKEADVNIRNPTIVTEAILRAYLEAADDDLVAEAGRWSETTKSLAAMQVGETISIDATTRGVCWQRQRPARILMGNPEARWSIKMNGLTATVTRREDGSPPPVQRWSPLVERLASMSVGERQICPEVKRSPDGYFHLNTYYQQAARKRLGNPDARWRGENTNKGLRVERLS